MKKQAVSLASTVGPQYHRRLKISSRLVPWLLSRPSGKVGTVDQESDYVEPPKLAKNEK